MRIFVYALGGGMGHLTRALSFARAAIRAGHHAHLLTNSVYAPIVRELAVECFSAWHPNGAERLSIAIIASSLDAVRCKEQVVDQLVSTPWDVLLVDTFPRGLGGELAPFLKSTRKPAFLVHRKISERYVQTAQLQEFCGCFSGVFVAGENGELSGLENSFRTAPWLICDESEILDRVKARDSFGITSNLPLVLVVGTGKPDEERESKELYERVRGQFSGICETRMASASALNNRATPSVWPLMMFLRGVDLVVGAGGYNTVHECRAAGTPLLARSQPRLYDRQSERLNSLEQVHDVEDLLERIGEFLRLPKTSSDRNPVRYQNGTHAAVDEMQRLVLGTPPRITELS